MICTKEVFLAGLAAALFCGCASTDPNKKEAVERGPNGTIAYTVEVEASEPGVKIEANGDYIGATPCILKIFGDKDGTFHNFGSYEYVIRAIPQRQGQLEQTKVFHTGGWFTPEDRIPKKIYFEMGLKRVSVGSSWETNAPSTAPATRPEGTPPIRSGTGFFISDDGYLITNDHVVREGARFEVVVEGGKYKAECVRKDKSADLALLKVDLKTEGLPLADKADAKVGQSVYSLGFPLTQLLGEEPKFTAGMINALSGMQDDWGRFQFSAQVTLGNSGGALVNDIGNVVGVVVSGFTGALPDVNYAIKASRVRVFLEECPVHLKQPKTGPKSNPEEINTYMRASTAKVISYPL